MGISIIAFLITLGVLIFFHELGHFLLARLFGVGVEKFSLGFGPRLIGKKIGITDYRISAVPLGGYVKMVGEDPDAEVDPKDISISFTHKHVFKRILIVAAGPIFNVLLAIIIFFAMLMAQGTYDLLPVAGEVGENKPAQKAGLQKGDRILAINGHEVNTWLEMTDLITASKGNPLLLLIRRGDSEFDVTVTPQAIIDKNIYGEEYSRHIIGISPSPDHKISLDMTPLQALSESVSRTYEISKVIIIVVGKIITGDISPKNLGGPIMIAKEAGNQAKMGANNLIFFIALLSINLAILNFLPIPVLDGGHLLFFFIEAIIRRPVSLTVREHAQKAGIFILIMLMIYVFYNDFIRYFSQSPLN